VLFVLIILALLTRVDNKFSRVIFVDFRSVDNKIPVVIEKVDIFVIIAPPAIILLEVILELTMLDIVELVAFKDGNVILVTSKLTRFALVASKLLDVIDDVIKLLDVIFDTLIFDVVIFPTLILLDCNEVIVPLVVSIFAESKVPNVANDAVILDEDIFVPYKLLNVMFDVLMFVNVVFVALIVVESNEDEIKLLDDIFDTNIFALVKLVFITFITFIEELEILVLITFAIVE
jgi:hypothetical protein